MDELKQAVKIAFASEFTYYLKAHFFHWNVQGPGFPQYHELFGDIYKEVHKNIDIFAEKIRTLGTYTPGSLTRFSMLSTIEDETEIITAEAMIGELLRDSEKMIIIYKKVFSLAEDFSENGLSNFIADRQDAHAKYKWMLSSILSNTSP